MLTHYEQAVAALGKNARDFLSYIPSELAANAQELRLRINSPPFVTVRGKQIVPNRTKTVTADLLQDIMQSICSGSVYSYQEDIARGFITLNGGHRAGLCGKAVYDGGKVVSVREISSVCLRIASPVNGCGEQIVNELLSQKLSGTLIAGPPCSGKTTILRDISRILSSEPCRKRVCIADERGEIAGIHNGRSCFELDYCDVLTDFAKSDAISRAVRCLSPDVIICDELGGEDDVHGLTWCVNSGVAVIATMHAGSREELAARPQTARLLMTGAFENIVMLGDAVNAGTVHEIFKAGDLL